MIDDVADAEGVYGITKDRICGTKRNGLWDLILWFATHVRSVRVYALSRERGVMSVYGGPSICIVSVSSYV